LILSARRLTPKRLGERIHGVRAEIVSFPQSHTTRLNSLRRLERSGALERLELLELVAALSFTGT
jgi:hypothetical protein